MKDFLTKNLISPKALSEFCEDLTASAIRFNNYTALDDLISLNMFPKNVNSYFSNDVGLTYFEYSIVYTNVDFINRQYSGYNMSLGELAIKFNVSKPNSRSPDLSILAFSKILFLSSSISITKSIVIPRA